MEERRASPKKNQEKDFLDLVIEEMKKNGSLMTEAMALDLLLILAFAAFETTSTALTLAVKNVGEHPQVLDELTVSFYAFSCLVKCLRYTCVVLYPMCFCYQKEHEAILRNRENKDQSGIAWQEYKSMTFTQMVSPTTLISN